MWRRPSIYLSIALVSALWMAPRSDGFTPSIQSRSHKSTVALTMAKEIKEIKTENAPAPVGPYSQALLVGTTLYCSGSLALDPKTGEFVGAGDIQAETRQVLKNMGAILEAAGASPKNVVRCTIFLADLADFAKMNEVYSEFFKDNTFLPTRTCVQAGALPKAALVEIDCIAEL